MEKYEDHVKGTKNFPGKGGPCPQCKGKSREYRDNCPTCEGTGRQLFRARKGYHGIIRKPTKFLVGEGGRPERVNISPIKKHKPLHRTGLHIGKINIGNVKIRKFI